MLRRAIRFFTLAFSALSLLLLTVLLAVWVLSYWSNRGVSLYTPDSRPPEYLNAQPLQVHFVSNYRGALAAGRYKAIDDPEHRTLLSYELIWRNRGPTAWREGFPSAETAWSFIGLAYLRYTPGEYVLIIPHWFPALLLSLAPMLVLRDHLRKRSRLARGLCLHCGYDLRASPGLCPECGHAAPLTSAILQGTPRHG